MTNPVIFLIRIWRLFFSPDHAGGLRPLGRCRFYPSCSEYAEAALRQYGLFYGLVLSCRRIFRCHPFSKGGHDPLM